MKSKQPNILIAIVLMTLVGCASWPFSKSSPPSPSSPAPEPTAAAVVPTLSPVATLPEPTGVSPTSPPLETVLPPPPADNTLPPPADPFTLLSQETLLDYLEDLTAIQPYSGWRNSATEGEAEALDYVADTFGEYAYLQELGLELERQGFHAFLGTELWETRLHLTIDGQEIEVPADGLRGPRDEIAQALRFDSDGLLNDSTRDPVVVEGQVVLIRSVDEIRELSRRDVRDKVVFLDYEAIDLVVQGDTWTAIGIAWDLLEEDPAGLVLVTTFSNQDGESHGTFVGDNSALNWVETKENPPTLYVRLEDLGVAGISEWSDLERIRSARLIWDADVFSPATSGNLVARIPGADPSRAVILGAHIDSPNGPGALDDGSGSVVLLEVARVLDASQTQPPMDLYLVWFGSEEIGLYGASHFANTHQELLDRTVAMLQIDCLTYPLDGIEAELALVSWSYGRLGDDRLLWPDFLAQNSAQHGVGTALEDLYYIYSDNSSLAGYDVPNADLIYQNEQAMEATGSLHYAAHIHDPYDTVELVQEMGDVLEQMARVVLSGALELPPDVSALRVTPRPDRRALFVASHTESVHMAPTSFIDLGMALAWEGFDVDLVPYGQPVTAADLEGTDLVIALPVVDYPSPEGDPDLYDEEWSPEEIAALEAYTAGGGLLVLTNSANRLKYGNAILDPNEDWKDVNALGAPFGITYQRGTISGGAAQAEGQHPLLGGVQSLAMAEDNGVPFRIAEGEILARAGGELAVALTSHGAGQVLVLADVSILGAEWGPPDNLVFWQNLGQYARR